jgi:hypothetical protein
VAGAGAGAAGIALAAGASALLVKYGLKARPLNETNILNPETERMLSKEVNANANAGTNPNTNPNPSTNTNPNRCFASNTPPIWV